MVVSGASELAVAGARLLVAWAAGRRLLTLIWPEGRDTGSAVYIALGLGLGSIAAVVFALGSAGWLGRPLLTLLLACGALAGALDLILLSRALPQRGVAPPSSSGHRPYRPSPTS